MGCQCGYSTVMQGFFCKPWKAPFRYHSKSWIKAMFSEPIFGFMKYRHFHLFSHGFITSILVAHIFSLILPRASASTRNTWASDGAQSCWGPT
ncbi:hypothetical protein GDO81_013375 [Engystomops pustulosus]|uniref:Uncharacterized protein n=1 Tax=Engystomops pustulosus TaxID=76066 RepID=A0AAV7B006_ENGPU|nr:hypothetical protein GDO81_013375 [Engystomops pustulosus]